MLVISVWDSLDVIKLNFSNQLNLDISEYNTRIKCERSGRGILNYSLSTETPLKTPYIITIKGQTQ